MNKTATFICQKELTVYHCYMLIVWSYFSGSYQVYSMHIVSEAAISKCPSGAIMHKSGSVAGLAMENVTSDGNC